MIPREDLERVAAAPRQLAAFLAHRGWLPSMGNDELTLWIHEEIRGELLQPRDGLPSASSLRKLENLIGALSDVEGVDPRAMARDIVFAETDVVRIRVHPSGPAGTVSIARAHKLIRSGKNMLLAAASTVDAPRAVLGSRKPEAAEEYGRTLSLSTEPGSFILNLYAPVAPDRQTRRVLKALYGEPDSREPAALFDADVPYARRVSAHLLRAVRKSVKMAARVERDEAEITEFDGLVHDGVSANLLEAISALSDPDEGTGLARDAVEIGVRWAAVRPAPARRVKTVRLAPDTSKTLAEAGKSLRARAPLPGLKLTGTVIGLQQVDPGDPGRVTVRVTLPMEKSPRHAHFNLRPDLYELAVRAHGEGEAVEITGDVVKLARSTEIQAITRFAVRRDNTLLGDADRP